MAYTLSLNRSTKQCLMRCKVEYYSSVIIGLVHLILLGTLCSIDFHHEHRIIHKIRLHDLHCFLCKVELIAANIDLVIMSFATVIQLFIKL